MSEIGSGHTDGDYLNSDFYNDTVASHDKSKTDSPDSNKSKVKAAHVNDLAAEVVGVEKRIGAGVRGSQTDLKARLDHGQNNAGDPGGIRQTIGYTTLDAALKDDGAAMAAGVVQGEPGHTETLSQVQHDLDDDIEISLPRNYKIDWTKNDSTAGVKVFSAISKNRIRFNGGEIDQNATGAAEEHESDAGIFILDAEDVQIRNMYIHDTIGDAIYLGGVEDAVIEGNRIEVDRTLSGQAYTCITVSSGSAFGARRTRRVVIKNNVLKGGSHSTIDIETNKGDTYPIEEVVIEGNHIYDSITGINIYGSTIKRLIIKNNTIVNPSSKGIYVAEVGSGKCEEIIVEGNTIIGAVDGIYLNSGRDVKILGNSVRGCSSEGIYVYQGFEDVQIIGNTCRENDAHGIYLNGASGSEIQKALVSNNLCINNGQATTGYGIALLYVDDFICQNNQCIDDQGSPTQLYGLWFSNSENGVVAGNFMKGNATSDEIQTTSLSDVFYGLNFEGDTEKGFIRELQVDSLATAFMAYFKNDNGVIKIGHDGTYNKIFSRNAADDGNKAIVIAADATDTQLNLDTSGRIGFGVAASADGRIGINMTTEDLHFVDAGSAAATEQDWIEVKVGGIIGYLRVFAAK